MNTQTGKKEKVNSSPQLKSWKIYLQALNKAIYKAQGNNSLHTGYDNLGNPVARMEIPNSGHRYKPNKKDKNNPKQMENMNNMEVRFDKYNITRTFTAFPY